MHAKDIFGTMLVWKSRQGALGRASDHAAVTGEQGGVAEAAEGKGRVSIGQTERFRESFDNHPLLIPRRQAYKPLGL